MLRVDSFPPTEEFNTFLYIEQYLPSYLHKTSQAFAHLSGYLMDYNFERNYKQENLYNSKQEDTQLNSFEKSALPVVEYSMYST